MSHDRAWSAEIRPTAGGDITALKVAIEGVDLFPSDMLDDMIAPFLAGAAPEERWLTANVKRTPVALAYYVPERMTRGTWNLLLIAVHQDWQALGIGTALMRHIEADLASAGERILLVETSGLPKFAATRAFYRHIGYEQEARIRDFYDCADDKLIFRKTLNGLESHDTG